MVNKSAAIVIKSRSVLYLRKRGFLGVIQSKGFNKSLDKLETIRLSLHRVRLLDKIKLSREIFDKTFIKHKNIHRYLLTPVGIGTIEFLHAKRMID